MRISYLNAASEADFLFQHQGAQILGQLTVKWLLALSHKDRNEITIRSCALDVFCYDRIHCFRFRVCNPKKEIDIPVANSTVGKISVNSYWTLDVKLSCQVVIVNSNTIESRNARLATPKTMRS